MIFGIGTDIVDVTRIEALWARYGERFAAHILSERELSEYQSDLNIPRLLAKRFAAKEAFAKAVGSGMRHPVNFRRIGITHDGLGKPVLRFDETLRIHLAQIGVNGHHLSISDERDMAVAFVVLESM
ncbi:MAG: holo-ACP synthase [Gallionellales bacterium RIFCSPLOWO2_12_FULL_59_22]|nr:MAG: holo-ACP synthase [Gallionellales bacterium RIFCSPLOWO2_02_FULL_59_110]OGT05076.1 MAG: holo-ACP synthase [Gallionellales bacterium RIFCSPLOWO2_02_58_13]OGT12700.1 MAG: holo-ACP synthase [Gallionellales bacterium RIFCSPLOWO2_12_FULL_59_22]